MAGSNDWLGGYTLEELLGAPPVSKTKKQIKKNKKQAKKADGKRGVLSTVFGAPFRLVASVIKLPIKAVAALVKLPTTVVAAVMKLPFRLIAVILKPVRRKNR